jgi:endonuclease/exonuclease/phosphatase family metal-dependent hydrolase
VVDENISTTYHIDYTFVSRPEAIEAVTMGLHADWIAHSDHSPMTIGLRIPPHRDNCAEAVLMNGRCP